MQVRQSLAVRSRALCLFPCWDGAGIADPTSADIIPGHPYRAGIVLECCGDAGARSRTVQCLAAGSARTSTLPLATLGGGRGQPVTREGWSRLEFNHRTHSARAFEPPGRDLWPCRRCRSSRAIGFAAAARLDRCHGGCITTAMWATAIALPWPLLRCPVIDDHRGADGGGHTVEG